MMAQSPANGITSVALVGMASVVASMLYRKRQTQTEGNSRFWNEFWNYVTVRDQSLNKMNDSLSMTFAAMYNHLHLSAPSKPVAAFITKVIDGRLNQIRKQLNIYDSFEDKNNRRLNEYLDKHPLRILLPFCGSSYDLYYISSLLRTRYKLRSSQFKIIGIDSCATAISHFFHVNGMVYDESCYNPKLFYLADFYRVWTYSNIEYGINIIENDLFKYFELSKQLESVETPCLLKEKSIDIIVDINAMSCCNPSDRKRYIEALRYWVKDEGSILLNTFDYDPKLSTHPPFAVAPNSICNLFHNAKCILLENKQCLNDVKSICNCQSWLIQK
eukprot:214789_1